MERHLRLMHDGFFSSTLLQVLSVKQCCYAFAVLARCNTRLQIINQVAFVTATQACKRWLVASARACERCTYEAALKSQRFVLNACVECVHAYPCLLHTKLRMCRACFLRSDYVHSHIS